MSIKILTFIVSSIIYGRFVIGNSSFRDSKQIRGVNNKGLSSNSQPKRLSPKKNSDNHDGGMKDEYGSMDSTGETYIEAQFQLESGITLRNAQVIGKIHRNPFCSSSS